MKYLCLFFFLLISIFSSTAQNSANNNLRVFLDCQSYCDQDFIKREINFVDYVNDRFQSNIFILINSQITGSGGREYSLQFSGRENFNGVNDTLNYIRPATATNDEDRLLLVQSLKMGLVKYVARTDKGKDLIISYNTDTISNSLSTETSEKDPWNLWIFNVGVNGYMNGDKNYSVKSFNSNASASRITEKHKTTTSISFNINHNRFGEGEDAFEYTNKSYRASNTTVWSISDRFSTGFYFSALKSDFSNYNSFLDLSPAIEYNFFPYKESNNHYFGLMYKIGPRYFDYMEETIFFRMSETRFQHNLSLNVSFNQKWGQVSGSASYGHYFHDFSKNRLSFSAYTDIRLYKGLSLTFNGYYAFQRDQLNIIKGNITNEDLLTRRRQLDSNYSFYSSFGVRYRFGSLFNNVVNPRFDGGGGGMFF